MEEAHHQYSGGCAARISNIISMDEGVQYRTPKTAHVIVGGCIFLGKMIFYDNLTITYILSCGGCIQVLLRSL